MRFEYDRESDALYVRLTDGTIVESEEIRPGIVLDFDNVGDVVGVEILSACGRNSSEPQKTTTGTFPSSGPEN